MDIPFLIGLVGAIILVMGAAYPVKPVKHPTKSIKNWLFAIGAVCMFIYALLGYLDGGPIFFLILQILVAVSTVLMMLDTPDKVDVPILGISGLVLIIWSLTLFEGTNTVFFVIGLVGIALGYALKPGSIQRNLSLTLGSALIAIFSYIEKDAIFFWLNTFFALFSAYYVIKLMLTAKHPKKKAA